MAKVRNLGLLPTSLATRALAVTFQSVTTSARAGATHSTLAIMPGTKRATGILGLGFIAGLLVGGKATGHCRTRRAATSGHIRVAGIACLWCRVSARDSLVLCEPSHR